MVLYDSTIYTREEPETQEIGVVMIKDRYGVVNLEDREEFEKKFQLPFGYKFVSFNYREAEDICKVNGKGYVVEKITSTHVIDNEREIIYRA